MPFFSGFGRSLGRGARAVGCSVRDAGRGVAEIAKWGGRTLFKLGLGGFVCWTLCAPLIQGFQQKRIEGHQNTVYMGALGKGNIQGTFREAKELTLKNCRNGYKEESFFETKRGTPVVVTGNPGGGQLAIMVPSAIDTTRDLPAEVNPATVCSTIVPYEFVRYSLASKRDDVAKIFGPAERAAWLGEQEARTFQSQKDHLDALKKAADERDDSPYPVPRARSVKGKETTGAQNSTAPRQKMGS